MSKLEIPRRLFTSTRKKSLTIRVGDDFEAASQRILEYYNYDSIQHLIMEVYERWLLSELTEDEIRAIMAVAKSEQSPSYKKSKKK